MNRQDLIHTARMRIDDLRRLQEAGLISLDGSFYPSGVHYPPITMYPPATEESIFETYSPPPDRMLDIYVHIPFCLTKCTFCHYPKINDTPAEKDLYLKTLEREVGLYTNRLGIGKIQVRSVLVGGGTPTHLSPGQLDGFLRFLTTKLDFSSCTQFSYDVDPSTLLGEEGLERLKILKAFGVGRLTIGVQSLNDDILKGMNRHHTADEAIKAVERSRTMGFIVNTEYIFGYPGQTVENWIDVLERAVSLEADEIQLYRLKIDAYGDFQGRVKSLLCKVPEEFPSAEDTVVMKQSANLLLADYGYNENLRRVFSKKRETYSHYADNQCCRLLDQAGFGLTAFSSLRDRFVLNTQQVEEYHSLVANGVLPVNRGLVRGKDDQIRWAFILPLKNREVRKKQFSASTGTSLDNIFRTKMEALKRAGLLHEDHRTVKLTALGGFFADEVCQSFHHPSYVPFPREAFAPSQLNPYMDQG